MNNYSDIEIFDKVIAIII